DDDRRAGIADRLADDDEDAGADHRADAQRGEVEDPYGALESVFGVAGGVADEDVVGLAGEGPWASGGGHGQRMPGVPGGQTALRRPVPASRCSSPSRAILTAVPGTCGVSSP